MRKRIKFHVGVVCGEGWLIRKYTSETCFTILVFNPLLCFLVLRPNWPFEKGSRQLADETWSCVHPSGHMFVLYACSAQIGELKIEFFYTVLQRSHSLASFPFLAKDMNCPRYEYMFRSKYSCIVFKTFPLCLNTFIASILVQEMPSFYATSTQLLCNLYAAPARLLHSFKPFQGNNHGPYTLIYIVSWIEPRVLEIYMLRD